MEKETMNQQEQIMQLLDKLNMQHKLLMAGGGLARIEIDLMMATMRDLYEQLYLLQQNVLPSSAPVPPAVEQGEPAEPEVRLEENEIFGIKHIEPVTVNTDPKVSDPVLTEVNNVNRELNHEPAAVEVKQQPPLYIADAPVKAPASRSRKTAAESFEQVTTIAQSYTGKTTLHERMSSPTDTSIASHLQKKQVTDLRKSIGVNEKFVFVADLFAGDHHLFNKTIEHLNGCSAYEEAKKHLFEDLAAQFNWDTESKVFKDLGELVRRRFNA